MISVASVDVYKAEIRLRKPFRIATMETRDAEIVYVRVLTREGLVGWGEAAPLRSINGETQGTCLSACYDLAKLLVGETFETADLAADAMASALAGQATARSALEMACYDIESQAAGLPLVGLLGGSARRMQTDLTISIVDAGEAGTLAKEIVSAGYRAVKVKLGDSPDSDLLRVTAVREAVGWEVGIRVDANQAYDTDTALALLSKLAPFEIEFCEQPVRRYDHEGLARLHRDSPVPIMADESVFTNRDAVQLFGSGVVDRINIKLSKSGGLGEGSRIACTAKASGGRCMIGGMVESRLGATAAAHLASSSDVFQWYDLDSFNGQAEDPVIGGMVHEGGEAVLPDSVGLGASVDPTFLRRCEVRTVTC